MGGSGGGGAGAAGAAGEAGEAGEAGGDEKLIPFPFPFPLFPFPLNKIAQCERAQCPMLYSWNLKTPQRSI